MVDTCEGPTAEAAAKLVKQIIQIFGIPDRIVADNGSSFMHEGFRSSLNLFRIQ